MATPELNPNNFEIPLRSLARPVKIFNRNLNPTPEDDYSDGYSSSDCAYLLPNSSPRDSVFSMPPSSSDQFHQDSTKSGVDITAGNDFDLDDLENVQICTITDIVVICLVHLQNDVKPLGYITL